MFGSPTAVVLLVWAVLRDIVMAKTFMMRAYPQLVGKTYLNRAGRLAHTGVVIAM